MKTTKYYYSKAVYKVTLDALTAELRDMIPTLQHFGGYWPHDEYNDIGRYEKWLADTKRFLNINFPNDKFVVEFEEISKMKLCQNQQKRLLAILEAFVNQPTIVHQENNIEKKMEINYNTNFNNTNNQTQNQKQSMAVDIFREAIKNDLTSERIKELKKIIDEAGDDKEKARSGIISKLKSFGSDVVSNIVANIITNPMIWTNL